MMITMAAVLLSVMSARTPIVDKTGIEKVVGVHVNPWTPINMSTSHDESGPDRTWAYYDSTNSWRECMELVQPYGIDCFFVELNERRGIAPEYRKILDTAPKGFKVGMFFGFYARDEKTAPRDVVNLLRPFKRDLLENPHVLRAGGRPVAIVYLPASHSLEYHRKVFEAIEREISPMVFLFSHSSLVMRFGAGDGLEKKIREYLQWFDGISDYGYSHSTVREQRAVAEILRRVRRDIPGKIYEGTPHAGWLDTYSHSGVDKRLSRDWRESVDMWLGENPDAIELTNLFDHSEQSHVLPSYEREDLLLRYLQYALSKWRGTPFPRERNPELVLCNYVCAQVGWTPIELEVLSFPIDAAEKSVEVSVELCTTAGKVLETLGPETFDLSDFHSASFTIPSVKYAAERGVVPRLVYNWKGKRVVGSYNPMTLLSPSARPHRVYWARSTRNRMLLADGSDERWTLDGVEPGGTRFPAEDGLGVFCGKVRPRHSDDSDRQIHRFGILRDGLEYFYSKKTTHALKSTFDWFTPNPGGGLHWYNLEMQDRHGRRWRSLPIWERNGEKPQTVTVPIYDASAGKVVRLGFEDVRIPYFHWKCERDGGRFLLDSSGYVHNGNVNPHTSASSSVEAALNSLEYVGYNYYNNGIVTVGKSFVSPFRRDKDGRGYLQFSGSDCVAVLGTVFPGASTYEISVRPDCLGDEMGVFDSIYRHVELTLMPDGRARFRRRSAPLPGRDQFAFTYPEVLSKDPLPVGEWTSLQVTYDLEKIALYVNGEKQGEEACRINYVPLDWNTTAAHNPSCSHEYKTKLVIGGKVCHDNENRFTSHFRGGVRQIRAFGRNLTPGEFLR